MDRFWSKVDKGSGCWEWRGARFRRARTGALSYGMFLLNRKQVIAHRVSWQLTHGPIPEGMLVLHTCDNPPCVRPDHLYLGDHAQNTRDSVERRRTPDGERTWNHKLTESDVRAIRVRLAEGVATETIGAEFGISGRTIRYIRSGERWHYVG